MSPVSDVEISPTDAEVLGLGLVVEGEEEEEAISSKVACISSYLFSFENSSKAPLLTSIISAVNFW